jgi:hypothetical protein
MLICLDLLPRLLVIAAEENVARWAGKIIELGGGNRFLPWVLSLSGIPEITDEERAKEDPPTPRRVLGQRRLRPF